MAENANLPIPKELIEPYLKQAVASSIMQLMGDNGMGFVAAAVQNALMIKVDPQNGTVSSSSYRNETPYVEYLARDTIHKIARETVKQMADTLRPEVEAAVKKNLQKSTNALAKTLVDGMIKSLSSEWSVNLSVNKN